MARPRKDFAVVHFRALTDARFDRFGASLVKLRMAVPATAASTARGLSSGLWLFLLRLDDRDGRLPGDGLSITRSAFGLSLKEAEAVLSAMLDAELLEKDGQGLRVRGFEEAYRILYRERDREARREPRRKPGEPPPVTRGENPATVAVAVPYQKSKEEAPAGNGEPGPETTAAADPPEPAFRAPSDLSPGTAQVLGLSGVDLRKRPGFTPEWERVVEAAAKLGRIDTAIQWLKSSANLLRKPRDLQDVLEPRGKFGQPVGPAKSPEEQEAAAARRREKWMTETLADLRRLGPEKREELLKHIVELRGQGVRAELEGRLKREEVR